jgi:hypothetical protein
MPKPSDDEAFVRYDASMPAAVRIYCASGFHEDVAKHFHTHKPLAASWIADFNALVKRLATGEPLSKESFPSEPPGHAFKCGSLRFYGVFGSKDSTQFALSHVVYKKAQKLAKTDKERMEKTIVRFDEFLAPKQSKK